MVRRPILVRLACVRPAANVRSEPGSNSPIKSKSFLTSVRRLTKLAVHDCLAQKQVSTPLAESRPMSISLTSSIYYLVFRDRNRLRFSLSCEGPFFYFTYRKPSRKISKNFSAGFQSRRRVFAAVSRVEGAVSNNHSLQGQPKKSTTRRFFSRRRASDGSVS